VATKTKQWLILSLILAVFIIPMVGAYITYRIYEENAFGTTNHGVLVKPAINLKNFNIVTSDAKIQSISQLTRMNGQDRWILIYFAPGVCGEICMQFSYYLNQITIAMGKNRPNLFTLIVQPKMSQRPPHKQSEVSYAVADGADLQDIFTVIPMHYRPAATGAAYLIDPRGYLMMYYAIDVKPDDILKDLQHLIRS